MSPRQSRGQEHFEGVEPPEESTTAHITFLGASLDLDDAYELGESVQFTLKGHVVLVGTETREENGSRRVVKVRCDYIQAS